ncbi:MAG: DUF835 domain-containing protein [Promethearchaeota archaeon]
MNTQNSVFKEAVFKEILDNIPAAVFLLQNKEILYANHSFWKFYYVNELSSVQISEKLDLNITEVIEKESLNDFMDFLSNLKQDEDIKYFETILKNKKDEYTPFLVYGKISQNLDFLDTAILDIENSEMNHTEKEETKKGTKKSSKKKTRKAVKKKSTENFEKIVIDDTKYFLLVFVGITDRMNAEYNIIRLLNGVSDLVFMVNNNKKITYANNSMLQHLGKKNVMEVLNRNCYDLCQNVMCLKGICPLDEIIKKGGTQKDVQIKRNSGDIEQFYKANFAPLHNSDGSIDNYMITWKNTTDLHKHNDLIEDMSEILQGIKDPIIILNLTSKITYMNTEAMDFFGLDTAQFLVFKSLTIEIFGQEHGKRIKASTEAIIATKVPIYNQEITMNNSRNEERHFLMSFIPMHDSKNRIDSIMIHFRDITAERIAEKQLKMLNDHIIIQNNQLKDIALKLEKENIDLRNAKLIKPVQEISEDMQDRSKKSQTYSTLEEGRTYLILERKPKIGYEALLDQLALKKPGLIVSRQHPDFIKDKYNLAKTPIIWLNKSVNDEKKLYYQPNLELLVHIIKNFIKETKKSDISSIILLDGLEYLVIYNEFKKSLQFLEVLNELIMLNKGILLVIIDKNSFDRKEFAFILRNSYILKEKQESIKNFLTNQIN